MVGVGIFDSSVSLINSSVWTVLLEDSVYRLISYCGQGPFLVAPTVFDTVESHRKCRRPVGTGMMYHFLLSSKFTSRLGTVCSLEEQKSVCIRCSDTEEFEFSGTRPQRNEGGLECDNG